MVETQAELAQLAKLTPARVTQIMNLLSLAPDIQEQIFFLPPVTEGQPSVTERHLRDVLKTVVWSEQREQWSEPVVRFLPLAHPLPQVTQEQTAILRASASPCRSAITSSPRVFGAWPPAQPAHERGPAPAQRGPRPARRPLWCFLSLQALPTHRLTAIRFLLLR